MRNEEVLHRVKEERNIVHTIKRRLTGLVTSCVRTAYVTEGKIEGRIEGTGKRGRKCKQLLDLKETRRYCKLRENALNRTLWKTRFGRGYGPVARQTTE
jgi:hypothetical protein